MAGEDSAVTVTLRASTKDYEAAMKSAVRATERAAAAAEKAVSSIGKGANVSGAVNNMNKLKNSMKEAQREATSLKSMFANIGGGGGGIGGLLAAGAGGFLAGAGMQAITDLGRALTSLLDTNTRINNSFKVVGIEGKRLTETYDHLADVARANGAEFETLTQLYANVTRASEQLGLSQQDVMLFTERMAQGLAASGTSSSQASDGIRQLNQALASGTLRGDEFNSVAENLPVVARAIADGLGVTIGKLREMAADGQLTAKVVYDAFIRGSVDFEAQTKKTQLTIGGAWNNIQTSLLQAVGNINDLTGASAGAAKVLNLVADGITLIGNAAETASNSQGFKDFMKSLALSVGGPAAAIVVAGQVVEAANAPEEAKGPPSDPSSESAVVRNRGLAQAHKANSASAKEHAEAVRLLRIAYDEFNTAVLNSATTVDNLIQTTSRLEPEKADELEKSFNKVTEQIRSGAVPSVEDFRDLMNDLRATGDDTAIALADGFQMMIDRMKEAAEKTAALKVTAEDLAEVIVKSINSAFESTLGLVERITGSLDGWIEAFHAAATAAGTVNAQLEQFGGQFPGVQGTPGGLTPGNVVFNPTEAKEFLKGRTPSAKYKERMDALDDDMATYLSKLFQLLPKATIISGVRNRAEQEQLYKDYKSGKGGLAAKHSLHEVGKAVDIGGVSAAELKAAVDQISGLETLRPGHGYEVDKMHVQLKGARVSRDSWEDDGKAEKIKKESTALDDWLQKSQQAIELKKLDNQIDADSTATLDEKTIAKEREALIQQGLNAVLEQYGVVSDENRAKVIAAADAQARLGLAAATTAEAQKKAADAAKAQTEAAKEFGQQIAQIAQSAISGLISDLRNGVEAGEAFNNMLNRILDSLIQMALQSLFSAQGLGGIFSGLFGAAATGGIVGQSIKGHKRVDPAVFAGAPHFAMGGIVGDEVPIIAHRGELVVPKNMVGQVLGGGSKVTNNVGSIKVDMSRTGVVAADSDSGKKLGQQIQSAVELILVRESRPGGILRRLP
jgi:tape measure domain-containing protein